MNFFKKRTKYAEKYNPKEWLISIKNYKSPAIKTLTLLLLVLLLSITLRILWHHISIHADEGEYGYTAMMWSQGYPPYSYRRDMQPPMTYFLYLLAGSLEGVRILNDIFFLISVIVMFYLAKEVLGGLTGAFIASAFYGIFMNAPALEGMFALGASMAVPFIVASLYFGLIYWRDGRRVFLLFAGILVSISGLIYVRELSFIVILMFIILKRGLSLKQGVVNIAKDLGLLLTGMLVLLLAFVFYFASYGLVDKLILGVLRPIHFLFVENPFPFPPLVWTMLTILEGLPLLMFSVGGIAVAISRRSKYDILLVSMLLLNYAVNLFVGRNFGHYWLNIVVPSALLSAIFVPYFVRINRRVVRSHTVRLAPNLFLISMLLLSFPISVYFQSQRYPTGSIYLDSISWGISPLGSYQNQTLLATFLRDNTSQGEQVLVHGWMPEIYYLSGIQAPSPNLYTYQGVTIRKAEYQPLLYVVIQQIFKYIGLADWANWDKDSIAIEPLLYMIIQQKFKYIVLADWANWDKDSIANATRVYYREIDRIGRCELYERQSLYQLIKDPSFEDTSNWVITYPAYATYTTTYAHSGNKSIAVIQSGNMLSNLIYQDVFVKGNTEYTFSAWGMNCPRNDIWFNIDETDINGKFLRRTIIGTNFISLNEWSQTVYKFTTLNATVNVRFYINILDVGFNYVTYFDDVNLFPTQL